MRTAASIKGIVESGTNDEIVFAEGHLLVTRNVHRNAPIVPGLSADPLLKQSRFHQTDLVEKTKRKAGGPTATSP